MNPTRTAKRGRQLALKLMIDQCQITRPGKPVIDPMTGKETLSGFTVYLGPCRVTSAIGIGEKTESAITGTAGRTESLTLEIPIETANVRPGDDVAMLESLNPALIGRNFRIAAHTTETFAISAKYLIEEQN